MLIPPGWFEKRASETEEQHAYNTRNSIGYEKVKEVMYIWLKTSERHKVDQRVMKEKIDENHPWVTDDGFKYALYVFYSSVLVSGQTLFLTITALII